MLVDTNDRKTCAWRARRQGPRPQAGDWCVASRLHTAVCPHDPILLTLRSIGACAEGLYEDGLDYGLKGIHQIPCDGGTRVILKHGGKILVAGTMEGFSRVGAKYKCFGYRMEQLAHHLDANSEVPSHAHTHASAAYHTHSRTARATHRHLPHRERTDVGSALDLCAQLLLTKGNQGL